MLQDLSTKETEQMDRETIAWVKNALEDREFGCDIYNILLRMRQFIEKRDRKRAQTRDWKKLFREFYDDNEAGGSSRWKVAPNIVENYIESILKD